LLIETDMLPDHQHTSVILQAIRRQLTCRGRRASTAVSCWCQ